MAVPAGQPNQFIIWNDPLLQGKAAIYSADSEANPRIGFVASDEDNLGALLPQVFGDVDTDARDIRLSLNRGGSLGSAEWVWRPDPTVAGSEFRGQHDPTYIHSAMTVFASDRESPALAYSTLHHRLIAYAVNTIATPPTIQVKTLDVDDAYPNHSTDWTDQTTLTPESLNLQGHALAVTELADGTILVAQRRENWSASPATPSDLSRSGDIDIWKSDDGGATHTLVNDKIVERFGDPDDIIDPFVQIRMHASGDWVRLMYYDQNADLTQTLVSSDGGMTWTLLTGLATSVLARQSLHDADRLIYDFGAVNDPGGTFFLCYLNAAGTDLEWRAASRDGDWTLISAFTRATTLVQSITMARDTRFLYTLVWRVLDAASGASLLVHRQPLDDVYNDAAIQARTDRHNMRGAVRRYPGKLNTVWAGRFFASVGQIMDAETDPANIDVITGANCVFYKMGDWNVRPNGAQGQFTLSSTYTQIEWLAFMGQPAPAADPDASGNTLWTRTQAGTGADSYSANQIQITGAATNDQLHYELSIPTTFNLSWNFTTEGAAAENRYAAEWVAAGNVGDGNVDTSETFGTTFVMPDGTDVYKVQIQHGNTESLLFDVQGTTVLATVSHAAIDNGDDGPYGRFRLCINPATSTLIDPGVVLLASRDDDPNTWTSSPLATLTSAVSGETEHEVRFGLLNQTAAGTFAQHWKEFRVFGFGYRPNYAEGFAATDLPGAVTSNQQHYLERGHLATWGGGSGHFGDTFEYHVSHGYAAENILFDSPRFKWRSVVGATTGHAVIFDAGRGTSSVERYSHDSYALYGLENHAVTIDYATEPTFGFPSTTRSIDTTFLTDVRIAFNDGLNILLTLAGTETVRSGYLAGKFMRITAGPNTENVFKVAQHHVNGAGSHLIRLDPNGAFAPSTITAADTVAFFSDKVSIVESFTNLSKRYMRLRFGGVNDKGWKDQWALGGLTAGISYTFPIALDWSHSRETTPNQQVFRTRGAVSWAYQTGPTEDIIVGTIRGDTVDSAGSVRDLLKTVALFGIHPITLVMNGAALHEPDLVRYDGSLRVSSPIWLENVDDPRLYFPGGGDIQLQFVEVA